MISLQVNGVKLVFLPTTENYFPFNKQKTTFCALAPVVNDVRGPVYQILNPLLTWVNGSVVFQIPPSGSTMARTVSK